MTSLFDGEDTTAGIVWLLTEIAAVNWLLVELADFDLVTELLGSGTQLASIAYIVLGAAGALSLAGSLGVVDLAEVLPNL
jgi:uncharacterized membrane protein YuzA (DUF378 family)